MWTVRRMINRKLRKTRRRERGRIKSPTETKLREYSVGKQSDMNHSGICIWKEREVNSSSITDTTRMIIQEVWNIATEQSDLSSSPKVLVYTQNCSVNTVWKNGDREWNDQNWFSQKMLKVILPKRDVWRETFGERKLSSATWKTFVLNGLDLETVDKWFYNRVTSSLNSNVLWYE